MSGQEWGSNGRGDFVMDLPMYSFGFLAPLRALREMKVFFHAKFAKRQSSQRRGAKYCRFKLRQIHTFNKGCSGYNGWRINVISIIGNLLWVELNLVLIANNMNWLNITFWITMVVTGIAFFYLMWRRYKFTRRK